MIRDYYDETRSPFAELGRHFFLSLFHPESTSGEDSFTTWLAQILAVLITASWFLPVQLFRRYSDLHGLDGPEPYRLAYASDCLSALVLMCLLVGVLTVLEWPALFPSRRDQLVLTPLPLQRTELFGAKLAALLVFVTLFIAAITLCCSVSLPAIASGRWEPRSVWLRMFAWFFASTCACYFVFLSLLAWQGLLMMLLPVRWFEPASFTVQMTLLVALLSGFPLFFYFPRQPPDRQPVAFARMAVACLVLGRIGVDARFARSRHWHAGFACRVGIRDRACDRRDFVPGVLSSIQSLRPGVHASRPQTPYPLECDLGPLLPRAPGTGRG